MSTAICNWQEALASILPASCVLDDHLTCSSYAGDASFYSLLPQVVVFPRTDEELRGLMAFCYKEKLNYTFRAAGTSLSGQSITDGMLIVFSRDGWNQLEVRNGGKQVWVQPGVIGQRINDTLRPYGAKFGPDPASIGSAMLGGMVNNNSSGMCCGVRDNAYHRLSSIRFALPNGFVFDTADPADYERFKHEASGLSAGIKRLRERIWNNAALVAKIRASYQRKNTVGYGLNAFLDFEDSLDIFSHLIVGSEGTLACVLDAVFNTIPILPFASTGLLVFNNIEDAATAIVPLEASGAAALEIMDYASLRAIAGKAGIPDYISSVPEGAAAILVEYQCKSNDALDTTMAKTESVFSGFSLFVEPDFTRDSDKRAAFWKIRKGLFPAVGAVRAQGSTVIIEDIGVPIKKLADCIRDLQGLFEKHGYDNAIIFGHAKDGNLHFVITPTFGENQVTETYAAFIKDLVAVVVTTHDGELKSEHGTGRNMAPFVVTQWGEEAYAIMRELKVLVDPDHLMNPGVIINSDSAAHLRDIKPTPVISAIADACIGCGFCESVCPSKGLTTSPRRRIAVCREVEGLEASNAHGDADLLQELQLVFDYDVLDTCATCGLCASACPVGINTGELVQKMRAAKNSAFSNWLAVRIAKNFGLTEMLVRFMLRVGHVVAAIIGDRALESITGFFANFAHAKIPRWIRGMPWAAKRIPSRWHGTADFLYYSSCMTRTMRHPDEEISVPEMLLGLAERAGLKVDLPSTVYGTCCGKPFAAKGHGDAYRAAVGNLIRLLYEWSRQGRVPIVVDTSPCTMTLLSCRDDLDEETRALFDELTFIDITTFAARELVPRLEIIPLVENVAVHPVCSVQKMGLSGDLLTAVSACVTQTEIPASAGCCGAAGDRLWLVPELTAAATREEAREIAASGCDSCCGTSVTCETALGRATGLSARSVLDYLWRASAKE